MIKDITRVEALLADGYAEHGAVLVLSNDRSYWQQGRSTDTIDAAFRMHDAEQQTGVIHRCAYPAATPALQDYSKVTRTDGQTALFRYLSIAIGPSRWRPGS